MSVGHPGTGVASGQGGHFTFILFFFAGGFGAVIRRIFSILHVLLPWTLLSFQTNLSLVSTYGGLGRTAV